MKLTVLSSADGITRVQSAGEITLADFEGQGDPLAGLLGCDWHHGTVMLSLADSAFIDSAGVGWLVRCHQQCLEGGGRFVVHSIPPMVNHVFRLMQLGTVLHLADDEAAALRLALAAHS
jgi:anti-anti-sigma factor